LSKGRWICDSHPEPIKVIKGNHGVSCGCLDTSKISNAYTVFSLTTDLKEEGKEGEKEMERKRKRRRKRMKKEER
jgi:hypothetical protein